MAFVPHKQAKVPSPVPDGKRAGSHASAAGDMQMRELV